MEIDFDKMQGLAPAVIQDATTQELLMVGFMNHEALEATLRTGFATFYSRTRQTLWTKGETSGMNLRACLKDSAKSACRVVSAFQMMLSRGCISSGRARHLDLSNQSAARTQ